MVNMVLVCLLDNHNYFIQYVSLFIAYFLYFLFFTSILCHWHPPEVFNSENKTNNSEPESPSILSPLLNLYRLTDFSFWHRFTFPHFKSLAAPNIVLLSFCFACKHSLSRDVDGRKKACLSLSLPVSTFSTGCFTKSTEALYHMYWTKNENYTWLGHYRKLDQKWRQTCKWPSYKHTYRYIYKNNPELTIYSTSTLRRIPYYDTLEVLTTVLQTEEEGKERRKRDYCIMNTEIMYYYLNSMSLHRVHFSVSKRNMRLSVVRHIISSIKYLVCFSNLPSSFLEEHAKSVNSIFLFISQVKSRISNAWNKFFQRWTNKS